MQKLELPSDWTWDGRKFKPNSGYSSSNTWDVTSTQLKPHVGANSSNSYDRNNQPIAVLMAKAAGFF